MGGGTGDAAAAVVGGAAADGSAAGSVDVAAAATGWGIAAMVWRSDSSSCVIVESRTLVSSDFCERSRHWRNDAKKILHCEKGNKIVDRLPLTLH